MADISLAMALQTGLRHHQAGRFGDAEALYAQVLGCQPEHPEALHLLGLVSAQTGRPEQAIDLIRRAISAKPSAPEFHSNLGDLLRRKGFLEESITECRRAVELNPNFGEGYVNLGNALMDTGSLDAAINAYHDAVRYRPSSALARNHLGNALSLRGQLEEAIRSYSEAVRLAPGYSEAYDGLGKAFRDVGRIEEAIIACRQAIALAPNFANAHNNLGCALATSGDHAGSVEHFRKAVEIDPNFAEAHNNLGAGYSELRQLDEAVAEHRRAIEINPRFADGYRSLANSLTARGEFDEARKAYSRAMELAPSKADVHSNWIYLSHYDPACGPEDILREHREWGERHARPLESYIRPHENLPEPDRRLRIGYVSPDFEKHVAGAAFLPPFREHDRKQFEIFCYSCSPRHDAITAEYQAHCDGWRNLSAVPDGEAAEQIRADQIDILVDLAAHTGGNRLLVFARKPAPVQVTHLGAWSTTGLETIDYRLSDPHLDPAESDLDYYREKTIRLPRSVWFYEPGPTTPDVAPLPAASAGRITFSCRNNFSKVSVPAFDLWMEILSAVPDSRLLMSIPAGACREKITRRLEARGLAPDRVESKEKKEPWMQFLRSYDQVDIALDPFPHCGWTTSCDALWMGVPVVSLSGRTAMGRGGRTILCNLGLPELVADTPQRYLEIAVALAGDLPRLAALRAGLRERMERSPLRDAKGLIRDIEKAYRQMWRTWCGANGGRSVG